MQQRAFFVLNRFRNVVCSFLITPQLPSTPTLKLHILSLLKCYKWTRFDLEKIPLRYLCKSKVENFCFLWFVKCKTLRKRLISNKVVLYLNSRWFHCQCRWSLRWPPSEWIYRRMLYFSGRRCCSSSPVMQDFAFKHPPQLSAFSSVYFKLAKVLRLFWLDRTEMTK